MSKHLKYSIILAMAVSSFMGYFIVMNVASILEGTAEKESWLSLASAIFAIGCVLLVVWAERARSKESK